MPERSIKLARTAQQSISTQNKFYFRFSVTASQGVNIDNAIFRFLRRPKDPLNEAGPQEDVFSGICTPEELESLPLNNPRSDEYPAWLRLATVDLIFQNEATAERAWALLQQDVQSLIAALKRMDSLTVSQEVTISG